MIRSNLASDFRGVEFKPIEFKMEGLKRSVSIPDVLSFEIEGVPSRNRSGAPFYIDNTAHPAGRRLALARTGQFHVHGLDSISTWWAKGTTAISRHSRGRRRQRTCV